MPEVIAAFCATEGWHERANPPAQTTNSSLRDLSQKCFEFAERHLDRVKVRRVLRQILHCCTSSLDCLLHAMNFVGRKVVYHHDVVALECRCQALLDIGHERCSVDWPVEDHRCHHLIMTQSSHERDRLPFPLRNVADQSLATRATAPETDHIDSDRGLIDKNQSRRIKKALLPNPAPTRSRHVGAVLLGCSQAFF
jgi:hypothetical protein